MDSETGLVGCHTRRTWTRTSRHLKRILALDDCCCRPRTTDLDDGRTLRRKSTRIGHPRSHNGWCRSRLGFEHHDRDGKKRDISTPRSKGDTRHSTREFVRQSRNTSPRDQPTDRDRRSSSSSSETTKEQRTATRHPLPSCPPSLDVLVRARVCLQRTMASSSLYWQRLSRLALGQQPRLFTSLSTHQPSRRVGIVLTRGVTSSSSASDDVTYARIVEESLSYLQEKLETLENTDIPGLDIEHSVCGHDLTS